MDHQFSYPTVIELHRRSAPQHMSLDSVHASRVEPEAQWTAYAADWLRALVDEAAGRLYPIDRAYARELRSRARAITSAGADPLGGARRGSGVAVASDATA
jgi:hypothetical protein